MELLSTFGDDVSLVQCEAVDFMLLFVLPFPSQVLLQLLCCIIFSSHLANLEATDLSAFSQPMRV